MPRRPEELHAQAAERLYLAVVNQAIFDVLENREEAKEAEQWLLSGELTGWKNCSAERAGPFRKPHLIQRILVVQFIMGRGSTHTVEVKTPTNSSAAEGGHVAPSF
jgi:hypothetical protein